MKKILKNYLFWTYPRGSFHYDVMVTLILVFIFVSPFLINYRERPQASPASAADVLVQQNGPGSFVYQIAAAQIFAGEDRPLRASRGSQEKVPDDARLRAALLARIQAISGDVRIDAYQTEKDASGRVTGYRVWAHR